MPDRNSLHSRLVGTWRFVTTHLQREDGEKIELYGPSPNGIVIFTPDGHFVLINMRPDRPRFASGNTAQATDAENRAAMQGFVGYFGTYSVDEPRGTYTITIQGSSFPNYEGTGQQRQFTIADDTLSFINPSPTVGGLGVHATLRRA